MGWHEPTDSSRTGTRGLFRAEAMLHHVAEAEEGNVLALSPSWTRWTFWLLAAVSVSGFAFLTLARVPALAEGNAVLSFPGRALVTAPVAVTVLTVEVYPGELIPAGADIVRARRRGAAEDLLIRSAVGGVVHDLAIQPGIPVEAGEHLLTLAPADLECTALVMFPGHLRSRLRPGMRLSLRVPHRRKVRLDAVIREVGERTVSPAEALRFLRSEGTGTLSLEGPQVLAVAHVSRPSLSSLEADYGTFDGMLATAMLTLDSQPLLYRLLPALN